MKKKILGTAILLASMLGVASLTSCGRGGVENAGEAFKLLSLDDIKGTEEPIVVEFWHSFGHNITQELDPLIDSFEEEMQKQGFNIQVKATATGGGYDGLRERVNLGTRSKSIPTLLLGYPDHFADYIANDILLPLDDFVNASDENIALEGVNLETGENDFIPSYWAENQLTVKGETKICGIPGLNHQFLIAAAPVLLLCGIRSRTGGCRQQRGRIHHLEVIRICRGHRNNGSAHRILCRAVVIGQIRHRTSFSQFHTVIGVGAAVDMRHPVQVNRAGKQEFVLNDHRLARVGEQKAALCGGCLIASESNRHIQHGISAVVIGVEIHHGNICFRVLSIRPVGIVGKEDSILPFCRLPIILPLGTVDALGEIAVQIVVI